MDETVTIAMEGRAPSAISAHIWRLLLASAADHLSDYRPGDEEAWTEANVGEAERAIATLWAAQEAPPNALMTADDVTTASEGWSSVDIRAE